MIAGYQYGNSNFALQLWAIFHRPDRVEYALNLSLKALKLDYVDLYLMHSAMAFQVINTIRYE